MRLNIEKINQELERREWTKYRLGKEMKVNRQWIYQVLSPGYAGITLRTIDKIATCLGYDPKDLII